MGDRTCPTCGGPTESLTCDRCWNPTRATVLVVVHASVVHPDHLRVLFATRDEAVRYRDAEMERQDPIAWFELVADTRVSADLPWAVVMSYVEEPAA